MLALKNVRHNKNTLFLKNSKALKATKSGVYVDTELSNLPACLWQLTKFTSYLTKIYTALVINYSVDPEITQLRFSLQII